MSKKKSNDPEESAENQELVRRVDAMMSTELPEETPAKPAMKIVVKPDEPEPVADKPKNQKTAPKLPPKLLKNVEPDAEPDKVTKLETPAKPPIVITLADESKPPEPPEPSEPPESPEEPAAEPETDTAEPPKTQAQDPLEDSATDKAVDDIVAHEGDTVLAVDDALTARKQATAQPGQPSGPRSSHKWFLIIILIILLGTAADAAIYLTR